VIRKLKHIWNNFRYFFRKGERLHYFKYRFKHYIYDPKDRIKIHTLEKGYHDVRERLLHGMFALLVDFIEVEKAWMNFYSKGLLLSKWDRFKAKYIGILRSPKLGLEYLFWEIDLKNDPEHGEMCKSQSESAQEELELYKWWTQIRPARPDSSDAVGLSDFYDKNRDRIMKFRPCPDYPGMSESYNELTEEEDKLYSELVHKSFELEEKYELEDIEMMLRLCKIQRCLWA
jgi:hypothetical protein